MRMLLFAIECWAVVNACILTFGFILFGLLPEAVRWWQARRHTARFVRDWDRAA
jgi:Flp pilus assembly protein TadB